MLSIVIPVRDRSLLLDKVLRSLSRQTLATEHFEVIVVDDGSTEDLSDAIRGIDVPFSLEVLRLPTNVGRAAARNAGARRARGDVLVFLDADSLAHPELLARHAEGHRRDPDRRDVVVGTRFEINLAELDTWERSGRISATSLTLVEADLRAVYLAEHGPAIWEGCGWTLAYTHNVSLRRAVFFEAGGFDEALRGWGLEDQELFYRVAKVLGPAGRFCYEPSAICYHLPHLRDPIAEWRERVDNIQIAKRTHLDGEFELFCAMPLLAFLRARSYYASLHAYLALGSFAHGGRPWVTSCLSSVARCLYQGRAGFPDPERMPAGLMTLDPSQPRSETNLHLLGLGTPFEDKDFDLVVSHDVWRFLKWRELLRFLDEAERIAHRLILIRSKSARATDVPGGLTMAMDTAYLARELSLRHAQVLSMQDDEVQAIEIVFAPSASA